ncbi:metallophosphoesterase [Thermobrachium celere]|uniref:metallophosphoesterase n=1 Tax=Thermobrachium celere TaxID=53422 RepID=UPI0019437B4D|nr:metallophosphoesterase [Thermobrachium celere]GFR35854.1 phosphohydrolase [Thermobrachium celere]
MVVFLILITIAIYGLGNYYLGLRMFRNIKKIMPFLSAKFYWVVIIFLSLSFITERFLRKYLSKNLNYIISLLGSYYIAVLFYVMIAFFLVDILRFSLKILIKGYKTPTVLAYANIFVAALIILLIIVGTINALNTKVSEYKITTDKRIAEDLNIVMVSDVHLGTIITERRLNKLVNLINSQSPDIVIFAGDLIDDDIDIFERRRYGEVLKNIKSKYGVYAVLGNHEYISRDIDKVKRCYSEAGIELLIDDVKEVNGVYLVGRDDQSAVRFSGKDRRSIKDLVWDLDNNKFIIVVDHQPRNIKEVKEAGVDLQLSGHTHKGQFFPVNYITGKIYDIDHGIMKNGDFTLVVSSGYGTWGPPIRIATVSEIVKIRVSKNK